MVVVSGAAYLAGRYAEFPLEGIGEMGHTFEADMAGDLADGRLRGQQQVQGTVQTVPQDVLFGGEAGFLFDGPHHLRFAEIHRSSHLFYREVFVAQFFIQKSVQAYL